jgi:GntR family transcriptional regulator, carbon starvation induced regulator
MDDGAPACHFDRSLPPNRRLLVSSEPKMSGKIDSALFERVKGDIMFGALPPNSKLRVRSLSVRYGVGGSPLREVLSRLVPEGLIEFEQNLCFWVAPLSVAELVEITEMRQLVEVEGFRRSMQTGDEDWEARVLVAHHKLTKTLQQRREDDAEGRLQWEARHRAFHLALIDACGNRKLLQAADQLYGQLARYRPILQINDYSSDELAEIHTRIFDLAMARDLTKGPTELARHFEVNLTQVNETLKSTPQLFEMMRGESDPGDAVHLDDDR